MIAMGHFWGNPSALIARAMPHIGEHRASPSIEYTAAEKDGNGPRAVM